MNMEIVSIEKKTFEMMVAAFGALSEKVAALRRKSDTGRMERWLTGEEVCGQLRISPRVLSFILLGGKVLYPETGLREVLEANYRKPLE